MANTKLTGTYYQIPENIISEITNTLKKCEEGYPGKKKAEFLVREKKLSYIPDCFELLINDVLSVCLSSVLVSVIRTLSSCLIQRTPSHLNILLG
jgi:hypothetical protein